MTNLNIRDFPIVIFNIRKRRQPPSCATIHKNYLKKARFPYETTRTNQSTTDYTDSTDTDFGYGYLSVLSV